MIVVDSSVLVTALADDGSTGAALRERLRTERLAAPEVIDLEVASVLRRLVSTGVVPEACAQAALVDLIDLPLRRVPHRGLLSRCWELRDNLTAYDAAYVSTAEAFDVSLLTADRRLARSPGPHCDVELVID